MLVFLFLAFFLIQQFLSSQLTLPPSLHATSVGFLLVDFLVHVGPLHFMKQKLFSQAALIKTRCS